MEASYSDGFSCGVNTGAHGLEYERTLSLVLFVRGSLKSMKFQLATEMDDAGKFDDVVFVKLAENKTMLIQAKHSTAAQPIAFKDLFELEGKDFDIAKYIKSYCRVEGSMPGEKQYFIFTNRPLNRRCEKILEWMKIETRQVDELLDFTSHGGLYDVLVPHEHKLPDLLKKVNSDFIGLKEGIIELFDPSCKTIPAKLSQLKIPLSSVIRQFGKCLKFSPSTIGAELYQSLKEHYISKNKNIDELEKDLTNIGKVDTLLKGDSRNAFPVYIGANQVRRFFEQLTFCSSQPDNLSCVFREDIRLLIRSWMLPDELGKLSEHGTEIPMKRFEKTFEKWYSSIVALVAVKRKVVPWLSWKLGVETVEELENEFSEKRERLYATYINRNVNIPTKYERKFRGKELQDIELVHKLDQFFSTQKCLLLTGEPGVGKTTFLNYVSHQIQVRFCKWDVFKCHLNDLKTISIKNKAQVFIGELFGSLLSVHNKQMLESRKNNYNKNVIILLDGFDEIPFSHSESTLEILKDLSQVYRIPLIISGRVNVKSTLEDAFATEALTLVPFDKDKQMNFLKAYWKVSVGEFELEKFNLFAGELLRVFQTKIMNSPPDFTGIPLMVRMLAEVYLDVFEAFVNGNQEDTLGTLFPVEDFGVAELYDQFIRRSFMIKMGKKMKIDAYSMFMLYDEELQPLFSEFIRVHQILALSIFQLHGPEKYTTEDEGYEQFMRRITTGTETSILISVSDDKVIFVHLSYAEYLVSILLYNNIHFYENELFSFIKTQYNVRRFLLTNIEENFIESCEQAKVLANIYQQEPDITYWACEAACVEIVTLLLKSRDMTRITSYEYSKDRISKYRLNSLLHVASNIGCNELILLLIDEYHMKGDHQYGCDKTSLEIAAINGHSSTVKLLVSRIHDIESIINLSFNTIVEVIENGYFEIAEYLMNRGCLNKIQLSTLLHTAISMKPEIDFIKFFIDQGVNIDHPNKDGHSPLQMAAQLGCAEFVNLIIQSGADINFRAQDGSTPLLATLKNNDYESRKQCLEILFRCPSLHYGVKDRENLTALHYAAKVGHVELIETLINRGVDVNGISLSGDSPLHVATLNNKYDFLKHLLERQSANVNSRNAKGFTASHYAAQYRHPNCLKLLFQHGADPNSLTVDNSRTVLHLATSRYVYKGTVTNEYSGSYARYVYDRENTKSVDTKDEEGEDQEDMKFSSRVECVKFLLTLNSIDVNQEDCFGFTALHYAVVSGLTKCIKPLIDFGARINAQTADGRTPLHLALYDRSSNVKCFEELLGVESINIELKDVLGFTALHYAAFNGLTSCVKLLINRGASLNSKTNDGRTALYLAFTHLLNNECARELLNTEGIDVTSVDASNFTSIHYVTRFGFTGYVTMLVDRGVNINAQTSDGRTALHIVARFKSSKNIIKELLSVESIDVNIEDNKKYTPMHYAALNGDKDCLKLIIDRGAKMRKLTSEGQTALHLTVCGSNFECAELLLSTGFSDVNTRDMAGFTALHHAAKIGLHNFVGLLVAHHADVNLLTNDGMRAIDLTTNELCLEKICASSAIDITFKNQFGLTALHIASSRGADKCLKNLLTLGADINARSFDGRTALHLAALMKKSECVRFLLNCGHELLDVTAKDMQGFTVLHYAASSELVEHLQSMLERGANINEQTLGGDTPLHIAVRSKCLIFIEALLTNESLNVKLKNNSGFTALHTVAAIGLRQYVRPLFDLGADINNQTNNGKTPLHLAIEYKQRGTIEELCSLQSIDVNIRDESGWTALQLATRNGLDDCLKLLSSHRES